MKLFLRYSDFISLEEIVVKLFPKIEIQHFKKETWFKSSKTKV